MLGGVLLLLNNPTGREAVGFLGGVVVPMLLVGFAVVVGPARRGLRVQPIEALREEWRERLAREPIDGGH